MKERTMRRVMIKYFDSKGIKAIASRGAGPDILIDGKAVEVKGSRYDFDRMLRQLVDYAYKYSDLALALPFDGLTLKKAQQLSNLVDLIKEARDIILKVYVVAPDALHSNLFYVRKCTAMEVAAYMTVAHTLYWGLDPKDPDSTIREAIENLIKYSPVNRLKDSVCGEYTRKISKVQI